MRVGTDILGSRVEGILDLHLRIVPGDAGFAEAIDGVQRTRQSPGSYHGEDGDDHGSKRRKKNVCEDTRFLCEHIKGLTD